MPKMLHFFVFEVIVFFQIIRIGAELAYPSGVFVDGRFGFYPLYQFPHNIIHQIRTKGLKPKPYFGNTLYHKQRNPTIA